MTCKQTLTICQQLSARVSSKHLSPWPLEQRSLPISRPPWGQVGVEGIGTRLFKQPRLAVRSDSRTHCVRSLEIPQGPMDQKPSQADMVAALAGGSASHSPLSVSLLWEVALLGRSCSQTCLCNSSTLASRLCSCSFSALTAFNCFSNSALAWQHVVGTLEVFLQAQSLQQPLSCFLLTFFAQSRWQKLGYKSSTREEISVRLCLHNSGLLFNERMPCLTVSLPLRLVLCLLHRWLHLLWQQMIDHLL